MVNVIHSVLDESMGLIVHQQQQHTFTYVSPCVLDGWIPVHVGQESQTEPVCLVGGVGESVYDDASAGRMEGFPDAVVELIVRNRTPTLRLLECHWGHICNRGGECWD